VNDALGKRVATFNKVLQKGQNTIPMGELANLATGKYFV